MTQAVIGHVVPAADGVVDGSAGGADAAAAPLRRLVGDAFRAGAAGQRPAGVVGTALARVEHQQLQIQAAGVLEVKYSFSVGGMILVGRTILQCTENRIYVFAEKELGGLNLQSCFCEQFVQYIPWIGQHI